MAAKTDGPGHAIRAFRADPGKIWNMGRRRVFCFRKEDNVMFETIPVWSLVIVLGPVILGAVIAYALLRRRRLTPRERSAQIRATERNYSEPEKTD